MGHVQMIIRVPRVLPPLAQPPQPGLRGSERSKGAWQSSSLSTGALEKMVKGTESGVRLYSQRALEMEKGNTHPFSTPQPISL